MTHLVVTRLRINVDAATAERSVETMARLLS